MSYNTKYTMSFHDRLGANFVMEFRFLDYTGDVTSLVFNDKPVKLTVNGNENDPFDTIHASQLEINIFQEVFNQQLYDDINALTDKTCLVNIVSDNFEWTGWLIPDLSQKTFSNLTTVQTVRAVDAFSYLKGVAAVDDDGKILYGKYSIISLLENAFKKGLSVPFSYELTSDLTISQEAPELVGHNILEQLSVAAESFNDASGRPPMCYDLIQKLLHGLGLTCSLKGEKVIITDITALDLNVFKEVGIMYDIDREILIGNEVITKTRAAKELSAEFQYKRTTGILPDGFFSDWTGTTLNQWDWNNGGTLSQIGNGRAENPYGVKLRTRAYETSGVAFEELCALRNTPYRGLISGSSFKIDFNVKYQDWRAWGTSALPNPQLQFGMMLDGISGKRYVLWQDSDYSKDQSNWQEMQKDGSGAYVRDRDSFMVDDINAQLFTRRSISLDSTEAKQSLTYNIPAIPEDGVLYVYISAAYIDSTISDLLTYQDRSDLIYYSVILSENLNVNANGIGGEKHYLTNFGDYSFITDTETFELETGLNESVAGSVYNAIEFAIPSPSIRGGTYPVGTQMNWIQINSGSLAPYYSLVLQILAKRMFYKRFSNVMLDVSYRSNTVQFEDLIKFKDGSNDLLPGVYRQLKLEYDLVKGEQTSTLMQLHGEERAALKDIAPTEHADHYEFYYQTN